MAPVLSSISPTLGAPGMAITLTGSGFTAASRVGCPSFVPTTYTNATTLSAAIPSDLSGPEGGTMQVAVFVLNSDGTASGSVIFTVEFPLNDLQSWTSIDAVCGEVPEFVRGGNITDKQIRIWMKSCSQQVSAAMLRRGLSLDPTQWAQPAAGSGAPSPAGVLELIARYGAAARLASAVSSQFAGNQGEWSFVKTLRGNFDAELKRLDDGSYDKIFNPAAATVITGQQAAGTTIDAICGDAGQAFHKRQVF